MARSSMAGVFVGDYLFCIGGANNLQLQVKVGPGKVWEREGWQAVCATESTAFWLEGATAGLPAAGS